MTFIIVAIFSAAALPYLFLVLSGLPSAKARARWGRGYDNQEARASLEQLEGWRKRAHFAQLNGHEAFAPFAAALLCAHLNQADTTWVHGLAFSFIGFRVAYGAAYIANKGALRSLLWNGGMLSVAALFLVAVSLRSPSS